MSTPSIGYEDDSILTSGEIATVQLVQAISLFVAGQFLCAVTLAGAAEEILGKLLQRRGELPVIRESTKAIERLRDKFGLSAMSGKSEKEMVDGWNRTRNALKHVMDDDKMTVNLCDEAYWMIKRGLANAHQFGLSIENEYEFENWIVENVT